MSTTSSRPRLAGLGLLALALGASLALSLAHLGAAELAGCGLESGCARAARSRFGSLGPWPTAHLGTAYFVGLLAAWIAVGGVSRSTSWIVRCGAVVSILLVAEMARGGYACPYCLAAHAANLLFWWMCERRSVSRGPSTAAFFVAFVLASGALWLLERRADDAGKEREERERSELVRTAPADSSEGEARFTGRYLMGSPDASIRLVVFSDFQCEDCRRVDGEVRALLESRDDVSLSIKHFPISTECNPKAREQARNLHPNACQAARAAEAAGRLDGDAGFERMHAWLFARGGTFTQAELEAALPELGFEVTSFREALSSPSLEALIRADIDEGLALGISTTPMVFVNGREFQSWPRPGALTEAVEAIAAAGPQADVRPASAAEKLLAEWRARPRAVLPPPGRGAVESVGAGVEVVLWGDYLDANTRELDRRMRLAVAGRPGEAVYSFRHFPLDKACNPGLPRTLRPNACLAALTAEAAHRAGGRSAFEAVHERLMAFEGRASEAAFLELASELGLGGEVAGLLRSADVRAAVQADVASARRLKIHSVPLLFIAGRHVPRWKVDGATVPETILAEAIEATRSGR